MAVYPGPPSKPRIKLLSQLIMAGIWQWGTILYCPLN
jgi:hypothetical protein